MTTRTFLALSAVAALSLAACDKSGSNGAVGASDADLMKTLPSTSNVVFGGDFMKVQRLIADTISRLPEASSKGMKGYVECFSQAKNLHVAGGVMLAGGKPELRVAMSGIDIATIETCATAAGFKVTKDPDGKFLAVEIPGVVGSMTQGYLALANGVLYSQQQLGMRHGAPLGRQALDAEATGAGKANVADDAKLQALIAKADKSKMLWFAGNAAGSPMGAKIGEVMGSLDVSPDISASLDVQITDEALATQLDGYVNQAKQFAASMPGDLKAVVDGLDYKKDGDRLHFSLKVTQQQLQSLFKMAGSFMGMGR